MSWLKRDFIVQAYGEIGLGSYVLSLQPEQLQTALRILDSMMAKWNGEGIRLGYPLPETANGSTLAEESGVPDRANEAIYTNLALRLASTIGRQVSPELRATAKSAYNLLLNVASVPEEMQMPSGMPAGAGNRGREFLDEPEELVEAGGDSELDI